MTDSKIDWELGVSRYIQSSPELVWRIMAERPGDWFCPKPWRYELVTQEARPGGRIISNMHGPNGEIFHSEGIFLAWEPGRRFVMTDAVSGDFQPQEPFMIGLFEVEPDGEGARYTARARHWSEAAMQRHKDMGFEEGWNLVADQLKALCEDEAGKKPRHI